MQEIKKILAIGGCPLGSATKVTVSYPFTVIASYNRSFKQDN